MLFCNNFIFLYCVILSKAILSTAAPYIFAPSAIQAFSHDVAVHVHNATVGQIVQLFGDNQTEAITAQIITKDAQISTLIFNCGYFFLPGEYIFKLRSSEDYVLAISSSITATKWPDVKISWDRNHEALTNDVRVTVTLEGAICKSDIARQNKLMFNLKKGNKGQGERIWTSSNIPVLQSSESFIPSYSVLPCETFCSEGRYKLKLIMTSPTYNDVTLATSDIMNVEWSKKYDLKIRRRAFPCQGQGVTVALSFPPCASARDSVRLLSVVDGKRTIITSQQRNNEDHVIFPCSAFYRVNQSVDGFCFQYVTEIGHVTRTICEPTNTDATDFKIPGSWSPWTKWRMCSRPCLAETDRRKRICNDPKPRGSGRPCLDVNGQENLNELETKSPTKSRADCDHDDNVTSLITSSNAKCECGCGILESTSGVVMSSVTNSCSDSGTVLWTVRVPVDHVIRFRMMDYQLAEDEVLTIRDGRTSWPMTSRYISTTTLSNVVIVQWVKSKTMNNLDSCGFIMKYDAVANPTIPVSISTSGSNQGNQSLNLMSGDAVGDITRWFERTVTENPVVLGGIAACALIIVILVVVVIVHCKGRRKAQIPVVCHTPMNTRLSMPPDGRSCSNDDTESEPMVRPRTIGNSVNCDIMNDTCVPMTQTISSGTAYYLAQRQLELMKRLGKDEHSQTYATGCLTEENIRQQEDLLFGDQRSLHKNEELKVTSLT